MAHLKLPSNPKKHKKGVSQIILNPVICPSRRLRCPYGCLPGQCLNGQCPSRMHGQIVLTRPDLEEKAAIQQKQLADAIQRQRKADREIFLEEERRLVGMKKENEGNEADEQDFKPSQAFIDLSNRKQPHKSMRMPARPLCMLEVPEYTPPSGDYAELSRFLRLSTMPGHSYKDLVSEYRGSHNMDVWDGQKDLDRQAFKMRRDWLSVWGEFNVKEQRWRKAWVEKFGADKV